MVHDDGPVGLDRGAVAFAPKAQVSLRRADHNMYQPKQQHDLPRT